MFQASDEMVEAQHVTSAKLLDSPVPPLLPGERVQVLPDPPAQRRTTRAPAGT